MPAQAVGKGLGRGSATAAGLKNQTPLSASILGQSKLGDSLRMSRHPFATSLWVFLLTAGQLASTYPTLTDRSLVFR